MKSLVTNNSELLWEGAIVLHIRAGLQLPERPMCIAQGQWDQMIESSRRRCLETPEVVLYPPSQSKEERQQNVLAMTAALRAMAR
jgi:hypothetical protein